MASTVLYNNFINTIIHLFCDYGFLRPISHRRLKPEIRDALRNPFRAKLINYSTCLSRICQCEVSIMTHSYTWKSMIFFIPLSMIGILCTCTNNRLAYTTQFFLPTGVSKFGPRNYSPTAGHILSEKERPSIECLESNSN